MSQKGATCGPPLVSGFRIYQVYLLHIQPTFAAVHVLNQLPLPKLSKNGLERITLNVASVKVGIEKVSSLP